MASVSVLISGVMSRRTPPTITMPYVLRLPVIFSASHMTCSRIRQACMKTVS